MWNCACVPVLATRARLGPKNGRGIFGPGSPHDYLFGM